MTMLVHRPIVYQAKDTMMSSRDTFMEVMSFAEGQRSLRWEMGYWPETLQRWYREGLKEHYGFPDYVGPGETVRAEALPHDALSKNRARDQDVHAELGMDEGVECLPVNSGPQPLFDRVIYEENTDFMVLQDEMGIKKKVNKKDASAPLFLDWPVKTRDDFERIKEERFQLEFRKRIPDNWNARVTEYSERSYPLAIGGYPYGFYGFLRLLVGEERLLYNLYDQPDLIKDILTFLTNFWIDLWEEALSQVEVDCAHFWEDIAYRSGPLISPQMFEEYIVPCYRRMTAFLRSHKVRIILVDTDGNIERLIPYFLKGGVTGLYPFEVNAGNDVIKIRKNYPDIQILGGLNKLRLSEGKAQIDDELESKVPYMLKSKGYIPFMDHNVPPGISWSDFRYYREKLNRMVEEAQQSIK